MIEIRRGGGKCLLTTLAGRILGICRNPGLAMCTCIMDQNVRLGLGYLITSRMRTGIGNIGVRVLLLFRDIRMRLGEMLEIGGLLDKLLVGAMPTYKLEILNVFGLHVIIHGILLLRHLVTILALEFTSIRFGIIGIRHFL
jgi:hypothetical protein